MNGGMEPTCPKCGMVNAMLMYHGRPKHHDDVQCRDCGFIVLVDPVEELHDLEHYYELADELWEEQQLGQTAGDIRALVKEIEKLRGAVLRLQMESC